MCDTYKKTTVPDPSAATDGGQSLPQKCNDSISGSVAEDNEFKERLSLLRRMNDPNYLPTITLTQLFDTQYKNNPPVIDNLLYTGTYLFVGAPKVGKSFLMAQLSYHVSTGKPLWGYPIHQGKVLYMALEDGQARLQKRLCRMFGTDVDETDSLYLSINAKQLNAGLEGQLTEFIRQHTDTRMIIIDTLQKIRDIGGGKYSYATDYEIITKLKQLSDTYDICVLLVHHTRKQAAEDCFETISGTTGLLGAADGAFLLQKEKRTDGKATLDITGRDQQDQRLYLEFDREHCLWQIVKAETEAWKEPSDPVLEAVAKLVTSASPEWTGSASELAVNLPQVELSPNALARRLNISADRLLAEYGICYDSSRNHSGRQVILSLHKPSKA